MRSSIGLGQGERQQIALQRCIKCNPAPSGREVKVDFIVDAIVTNVDGVVMTIHRKMTVRLDGQSVTTVERLATMLLAV